VVFCNLQFTFFIAVLCVGILELRQMCERWWWKRPICTVKSCVYCCLLFVIFRCELFWDMV